MAAFSLAACGGGGGSDGSSSSQNATLPSGSGSSAGNSAPTISGSPATTAQTGSSYSFKPAASDANGDTLGFSIQNKPAWAAFSSSTGQLSGTPTQAGTHSNIVISVSDGKTSTALRAFTITVGTASGGSSGGSVAGNAAPKISGSPLTSVQAGAAYSFKPAASDANGDKLTFSIQNKPAWASFNTATGQLSGTPTSAQVGTYSGIVIRVTDGKSSAVALGTFSITVAQIGGSSATLSWQAPTENTDGSALTNLDGYKIYYGTSSNNLTQVIDVGNVGLTTYVVQNLTSGTTYYFALKAYATSGAESELSNVASKQVM